MRLEEMFAFFEIARNVNGLAPSTVHNWTGAVSSIYHSLNHEERTVEFVQANLDSLRERVSETKPDIRSQTIDAYLQRTANAIHHFLSWKANAEVWERDVLETPVKRRGRQKKTPTVEARETRETPKPETALTRVTAASREEHHPRNAVRIPVESGEVVRLEFPDSISMADVLRVTWALAVHARDFDPEKMIKGMGKPTAGEGSKQLLTLSKGAH